MFDDDDEERLRSAKSVVGASSSPIVGRYVSGCVRQDPGLEPGSDLWPENALSGHVRNHCSCLIPKLTFGVSPPSSTCDGS